MAWSGCEHAASGRARYEIPGNPDGHSPSLGSAFLVLFQRVVARGKERLHGEHGAGVPAMICPQSAPSVQVLISYVDQKICFFKNYDTYKFYPI